MASLSCTLPIFLVVIGVPLTTQARGDRLRRLRAGMVVVVIALASTPPHDPIITATERLANQVQRWTASGGGPWLRWPPPASSPSTCCAACARTDPKPGPEQRRRHRLSARTAAGPCLPGGCSAATVPIMTLLRSVLLFLLAALAEIGGAWLIWQGWREHRGLWWIAAGILALGAYGFVATFQPDPHFGRILAAYGGIFVAGSLAWGVLVDKFHPDRWDYLGAGLCLIGVAIIMYAPRH